MLAFRRSGAFLRQKADIFECYYVRSSGIHEAKVAVVPGTGVFMCVGFHHNQRTRCSQLIPSSSATIILLSAKLEPVVGFEPTTDGLQNRSSTTELNWLNHLPRSCLHAADAELSPGLASPSGLPGRARLITSGATCRADLTALPTAGDSLRRSSLDTT